MSKRLRILLDGYIDGNFGDDLMLYLAADGLKEHKLYITSPKLDIAEYTEEFDKADLQLRVSKGLEPVLISLDGERIWRVLDNIMGNIVKYALPGTRVYMKLTDGPDFVRLVFKNISK